MKEYKTIWVFCFDNGDDIQSDIFVGLNTLTDSQARKIAKKYVESDFDYSKDDIEITEIYPVFESIIEEIKENNGKLK